MGYPFFMFTVGITTASALMLGSKMMNKVNEINKDWANQRCKPHIQALAYIPFFAPKGIDANKNAQDCQYNMAQGFFSSMISPFQSMLNTISSILNEFNDAIQNIRNMFNQLRNQIKDMIRSISNKIYSLYVRIAWLFKTIMTLVDELLSIFADLLGILVYAYFAFGSVWNGIIGGTARFFCFDGNSKVKLKNGKFKQIKKIKLGEKLHTGTALGLMKFTSKGSDMYNYKGVNVAGCHLVKENNRWIRVEDSALKKSIKYYDPYIYCLQTSDSKIHISNIEFADYLETSKSNEIYQIYHFILSNLNNYNKISKIGNLPELLNNKLYPWCIHKSSLIDLENGTKKCISDIKINDRIKGGNVIASMKFLNDDLDLYNYFDMICTGSMIVEENGFWIPVYESMNAIKIKNNDEEYYNICTDTNEFYCNGIKCRDFEQISDHSVNNKIDEYVVINKR